MANTYVAIAKTILTSTTASVTFSSIPQTYTDLLLVSSTRNTDGGYATAFTMEFNADATTKYSYASVKGQAGTVTASLTANSTYYEHLQSVSGGSVTASSYSNLEFYFPNYNSTSQRPIGSTGVVENNAASTGAAISAVAGLYRGTAAITSIKMGAYSDFTSVSFVSGSTFHLYGIKSS